MLTLRSGISMTVRVSHQHSPLSQLETWSRTVHYSLVSTLDFRVLIELVQFRDDSDHLAISGYCV